MELAEYRGSGMEVKRRPLYRTVLAVTLVVGLPAAVVGWSVYADGRRIELSGELSSAIERDNLPAIRRLLAAGADPNTPAGYRPPEEGPFGPVGRLFLREHAPRKPGRTALYVAVASGDLQLTRDLLRRGASARMRAEYLPSLLWLAAQGEGNSHKLEMTKLLVEAGADPNGHVWTGDTPLRLAIRQGDDERARYLIAHGADVQAVYDGRSLLWDAVSERMTGAIRMLLERGADVNAPGPYGRSVLIHAVHNRSAPEVLKLLLAAGADPNASCPLGTPLTAAVQHVYDVEVVRLLVEHGGNPDLRDPSGLSALEWARKKDYTHIIPVLDAARRK